MNPSVLTLAPLAVGEASQERPVALHRDILLASDASPAAMAATQVVGAIASRWPITPYVVTVVPPPPVVFGPVGASAPFDPILEEELARTVRNQLATLSAGGSVWFHEMSVGSPAAEIVRVADDRGSDLIVLGLRPHSLLDRVFRDETGLAVMRNASVPVLAVTPTLNRLPRRIGVAIDFSRASIAAARAALNVLDPQGSLLLVYVEPPAEPPSEETEGFGTIYAQGVAGAFARLRQDLASRASVPIDTVVLQGNVVPELLAFADRADVDVLAVGSQRHSLARRAFVGGVTTALARSAKKSLFVVPPGRQK